MEKFIQYLQSKNLAESSTRHYMDCTGRFFKYIQKEPAQIEKKHVLKYLGYLKDHRGQENRTRQIHLIAINHYFTFLLKQGQVQANPAALIKIRGTNKKHLYRLYTPQELNALFDSYYALFVRSYDDSHMAACQRKSSFLNRNRNAAMLSILVNQGTTTKETGTIFLQDIDLTKATLKVRPGKKRGNERTLPLKAHQIGILMHYIQTLRPQLLEYHTTKTSRLFLPLPPLGERQTDSESLVWIFRSLTAQVKTLDKHFVNFKQVRASVITYWLKTYGLRKTQVLAGHRYIKATENYLAGEVESLSDDIAKYNPF